MKEKDSRKKKKKLFKLFSLNIYSLKEMSSFLLEIFDNSIE
jgi:hypothetical protein